MNTSEYKVAVVMTLYNCSETVVEAIESILQQSFQDFCIIACDDGSTDGTFDIVKAKYGSNNRIILLKNEINQGRSAASNRCIDLIKCKYVARMDGDDISLPNRLKIEVDFLDKNHQYAFVSSPMIYFDDKGDYKIGKAIEMPSVLDFKQEPPFCHGPSLIRTDVLKNVGGYTEDNFVIRVEDADLWYRMYIQGYQGYNLSSPLYKMRNDYKAFSRRKAKYRWIQFRLGCRMRKKLGVRWSCLYSLPQLLKMFVPWQLLYLTRRIR